MAWMQRTRKIIVVELWVIVHYFIGGVGIQPSKNLLDCSYLVNYNEHMICIYVFICSCEIEIVVKLLLVQIGCWTFVVICLNKGLQITLNMLKTHQGQCNYFSCGISRCVALVQLVKCVSRFWVCVDNIYLVEFLNINGMKQVGVWLKNL